MTADTYREETVRRGHRRPVLVSLLVVLALGIAGAASAYWRGSGSGTGGGTSATTATVVVSPGSPTANLYPGGSTDVVLTLSNPNLSPIRVGTFSLDASRGTGGFAVDGGHSGCSVSMLSFTTQTTGWTVPAKIGALNGTLPVTLTGALAMDSNAANACQGAAVTVYVAAGA